MDGDQRILFNKDWRWSQYLENETRVNLPCRHCIGCNQASARSWSVRGHHEALLHQESWQEPVSQITTKIPNSSVITLTYNPEQLPEDGLLHHEHFQHFMQRLLNRRRARHKAAGELQKLKSPRYFMCGEYGGKTQRPHFHAVIFGETFSDRYEEQDASGQVNQMSYELDHIWSKRVTKNAPITNIGRATVDDFSFAGAAYVAGYVAKKMNSLSDWRHQGPIREETGPTGATIFKPISPEYRRMSTKPGLGADWILEPENYKYVYSADCVKVAEYTYNVPKYYDKLISILEPNLMKEIRFYRAEKMNEAAISWNPERCDAAETIALSNLQLRRDSL